MQHIIINFLIHFSISVITLSSTSGFLQLYSKSSLSTDSRCRTAMSGVACLMIMVRQSIDIYYIIFIIYHLSIHEYQRISQQTFYTKSHHKLRITSPQLSSASGWDQLQLRESEYFKVDLRYFAKLKMRKSFVIKEW